MIFASMPKDPSPRVFLLLASTVRENGQPQESVEASHKAQSLSTNFQATGTEADQMVMSIE